MIIYANVGTSTGKVISNIYIKYPASRSGLYPSVIAAEADILGLQDFNFQSIMGKWGPLQIDGKRNIKRDAIELQQHVTYRDMAGGHGSDLPALQLHVT